jgi:hypothetical protein
LPKSITLEGNSVNNLLVVVDELTKMKHLISSLAWSKQEHPSACVRAGNQEQALLPPLRAYTASAESFTTLIVG